MDDQAKSASGEKGEGNYEAAREYQQVQHAFAQDKAKVQQGARQAADALDGPEAEELETARVESTKGAEQRSK